MKARRNRARGASHPASVRVGDLMLLNAVGELSAGRPSRMWLSKERSREQWSGHFQIPVHHTLRSEVSE